MHSRKEEDGGVGEKGIFFSSPAACETEAWDRNQPVNDFFSFFGIIIRK